MKPAKLDAAPVSVSTPMITPTTAHAMPTPSACLAPSIRLARSERSVGAAAADDEAGRDEHGDQRSTGSMPHLKELDDAPMPIAIQNTIAERRRRNAGRECRAEHQDGGQGEADHAGEHRREAVEQHVDQRCQRQHQMPVRLSDVHGFGHWSLGRP